MHDWRRIVGRRRHARRVLMMLLIVLLLLLMFGGDECRRRLGERYNARLCQTQIAAQRLRVSTAHPRLTQIETARRKIVIPIVLLKVRRQRYMTLAGYLTLTSTAMAADLMIRRGIARRANHRIVMEHAAL